MRVRDTRMRGKYQKTLEISISLMYNNHTERHLLVTDASLGLPIDGQPEY